MKKQNVRIQITGFHSLAGVMDSRDLLGCVRISCEGLAREVRELEVRNPELVKLIRLRLLLEQASSAARRVRLPRGT